MSKIKYETSKHIRNVGKYIFILCTELGYRIVEHDKSKLSSPEVEIFEEFTPRLLDITYDSDEYKECLENMGPALDHHYANNRHHPEYFKGGIKDMNLADICEMLCDWKAASLRHKDGDILKSIELNQKRFGYSDDLKNILINTVTYLRWDDNE